jgi:EAL domain-containing protein (putative c-di-GMP-specific phosphodiesterase class I)
MPKLPAGARSQRSPRADAQRSVGLGEIRAALSRSMIETRYQPVVRIADRRPVALEVLARLNHPARGTLLPDLFVPKMEDAGLAPLLTETVARLAFADLAGPSLAPYDLDIALNFPLGVLLVPEALALLDAQRRHAGIAAEQVIIELTESRPVDDLMTLRGAIEHLRGAGYRVAIDDVGPSVPHLAALLELPFDGLKLDKGVVQRSAVGDAMRGFALATIATAKARGLTVTAEGAEDTATWDRMREMGVEQVQGFFVARPLLARSVPGWLRRWAKRSWSTLAE